MSRRARLFSEFLDGSDIDQTTASTVSSVTQDVLAKRRKTAGLNSRFDRMVETMNINRPPVKGARNRARSTSSTSGSSVPKTPIDDYDEFHRDARLGTDFSVIKMGKSMPRNKKTKKLGGVFPWEQDSSSSDTSEPPPPPVPLPPWLASTFSSLATKHPLRLLLPRRTNTEPTPSPPKPAEDTEHDDPFSFSVPADPIHLSTPDPSHDTENIAEPQSTQTPPRPAEPAFTYLPPSLPVDAVPPFSTPGPGSVISRSDSMLSVRFPEPSYVEFSPPFVSMSPLPEATYAIGTSFFMPPLHSTPPPAQFLAESIKPPSTDFYHHEDSTNDMDDSLNHSAYMDMYSTPGPGYRTVPPVYFDSPTEDPSDSDPLEPAYELDSLDFRWEPFIQKDPEKDPTLAPQTPPSALNPAVVSNSDDYYYEIQVEPEGEDDTDGQLYASINMGPKFAERSPSPGPFSFAPPADDLPTTHELDQSTPATPEAPFFAPVPGIFISPLRGNEALNTPPKGGESTQEDDHPRSSQISNDSIEDWDDDTAAK